MHHTYLFEKGEWSARGALVDDKGGESTVSGTSSVEQGKMFWGISGLMELHGAQQAAFANSYIVTPFADDSGQTTWKSENSRLGTFSGSFIVVKDSILSTGESACGSYVVSEWLLQIDSDRYVNRGVMLKNGQRISSWALELERLRI